MARSGAAVWRGVVPRALAYITHGMTRRLFTSVLLACSLTPMALALSDTELDRIGRRIWKNECNGTRDGLTSWNSGENFASLGIGHFIWYPKDVRGPFEESFPDLIDFASRNGTKLPPVVVANRASGCPWKTRAEFLAAANGAEIKELRQFLAATVDLQAQFLVQRLQQALPKMLGSAHEADGAKVQRQFERVASTPQGCYALV